MRLVELLLILLFEGRKALPKNIQPLSSKHMESFPGDASNRHVIEAIRAGNNEEFFEAMESGKQMYNKYYAVLMLGGCCFRDWLMFYFFKYM